ncbi:hypothetical protein LWF01_03340 [Saxibacter everestensis]|uniref:ABC transporter substrate-binding protein n=1 Tax=Saxibacter everestensis TaxID=2909229 RepID=A0ABY8QV39_9MICO|nr:hypothetical protein LWF01_03340 [Brevibacteriaceae bacterium ZFBP1038]
MFAYLAVPAAALALVLSGCATEEQASGGATGGTDLDAKLVDAAQAKAKEIMGDEQLDGSISIIGDNSGTEGALIEAFYKPFTEATGVKINYTGSADSLSLIQSRVASGSPPDLVTSSPGVMAEYSRSHKLLNLSSLMGDDLKKNYSASVLDTASIDGSVYGVYQGFNNYMMWFNPEEYTGPKAGSSWQDVADWTEKKAADGTPTWCNAQGSGASSGWPGEAFIETLFAKKYGPALTEEWGTGKLSWTSPQVKDAWQMFGAIAAKDANVAGGVKGSLTQDIGTGSNGLVTDPPTCQAEVWGSWTSGLITSSAEGVKPGENLDFMRVPASEPKFENTESYSATVTYAFKDSPEVRAFARYIASTEAQTLLASADHWPVSNINVPVSTYKDPLLQKMAKTYFTDDVELAAGPANLAKTAVLTQADKGVMSYLQDPSKLDEILQSIQKVQEGKS